VGNHLDTQTHTETLPEPEMGTTPTRTKQIIQKFAANTMAPNGIWHKHLALFRPNFKKK